MDARLYIMTQMDSWTKSKFQEMASTLWAILLPFQLPSLDNSMRGFTYAVTNAVLYRMNCYEFFVKKQLVYIY
jgi:hypothetical protein